MNEYIIIIPTYNESENITQLISSIRLPNCDLLFIDDNSPDGTSNHIKSHPKYNKNIYLIERKNKNGYASACKEGMQFALKKKYKYIVQMDADLSHSGDDLNKLIKLSTSQDLVIGSRYIPGGKTTGWGFSRVMLSKIANLFSKFYLRQKVNDLTSGFRVYNVETLNKVNLEKLQSEGYGFLVEILYNISKITEDIEEVPIHFNDRKFGQSKMSFKIIIEAVKLVLFLPFKN